MARGVSRNVFLIVVGGFFQWYLDVLHSNGLIPGSGDGGFPEKSWRRALGSFASQTMCTAGLYNLMDDRLPRTAARDAYLAILGLVVAAFIDTLFAYSEMRARRDSAYARAAAAATSELELGTAPIRSTRGEVGLETGRARAAAATGARHSPREPRRPGLHLDRLRQPLELLAVLWFRPG